MPEIIVKLGEKTIHRHVFDKDILSIGRARDNDVVIENLSVSRNHTRIRRQDGKWILTDLNSANGTLVNSVRVTKTELVHDDQIQIGKHILHFINQPTGTVPVPAPAPAAAVAPPPTGTEPTIDQSKTPGAMIVVTKGKQANQEFPVFNQETTIGRANENDVRLHDWFVSKRHAVIVRQGDSYVLKDLQSWRGTTVNNAPVKGDVTLKDGDELTFGTTVVRFTTAVTQSLLDKLRASVTGQSPVVEEDEGTGTAQPGPAPQPPTLQPIELRRSEESVTKFTDAPVAPGSSSRRPAPVVTDEFSAITDEELAELEAEVDQMSNDDHQLLANAEWEQLEGELAMMNDRPEDGKPPLLEPEEELRQAEEKFARNPTESSFDANADHAPSNATVEIEIEERALFNGPMGDGESSSVRQAVVAAPKAPAPSVEVPAASRDSMQIEAFLTPDPEAQNISPEERDRLVAVWQRALKNRSQLIRKNAAKELKKLTGKDYDWQ